jgi:DedD protein
MTDAIEPQLDELRRRARRRLVGAVVLALAAAVLVPMLLESDPKPLGEDVSVKIPPVDDGKFVSKLPEKSRPADAASPPAAKPAPAPKSPDAATAASAKDASRESSAGPSMTGRPQSAETTPVDQSPTAKSPVKEAAGPPAKDSTPGSDAQTSQTAAAPVRPAPEAAPGPSADATKASKPSKPPGGGFSVQLAAFSDDKGANALVNRLKKAGHPAYTEAYTTSGKTLWRVRVGPYPTREAAEAARTKLKVDGQNGIIAAAN